MTRSAPGLIALAVLVGMATVFALFVAWGRQEPLETDVWEPANWPCL